MKPKVVPPPAPAGRPAAAYALFLARSLGVIGWCGVVALTLGLAGVTVLAPVIDRDNAQAGRELSALEQRWAVLRDPRVARAQRDPVGSFVAALPPASDIPEFVAAVQRRADAGAVQIDRTEYRVQAVLGRAAQRYRLSFPAHVDYPHLRAWLEGLLHDYPSVVLDEITLRRAVDGGEELEAQISLSFLAQEGK